MLHNKLHLQELALRSVANAEYVHLWQMQFDTTEPSCQVHVMSNLYPWISGQRGESSTANI